MISARKVIHIVLACALIIFVFGRVFHRDINVQPDSSRYMLMGLTLADHILGPLPGAAAKSDHPIGYGSGGPLAAFEIGMAATLDPATRASLECHITAKSLVNDCNLDIGGLLAVYGFELLVFHAAIGLVAYLIFGNSTKAWLAVAASLAFKETKIYSTSILSEPSYMMAGGLFVLLWVYCLKHPDKIKYWFWCGVSLGLLILSKPSWQAMVPALIALFVLYAAFNRPVGRDKYVTIGVLCGGAALVFVPFIVRNGLVLDIWRLSDPDYLAAPLAHRFAFNHMSWAEWAAGWVYYLPDFGDSLAKSLFGEDLVAKLNWSDGSYYAYGRDVLLQHATAATTDGNVAGYLVREHFLNDLPKATAVTALFAWHGIFVGNLLGLAALILAAPVLYFLPRPSRNLILLLSLPIMIMVGVHALVSISLLRYNLLLVAPYALILAQALYVLGVVASGKALKTSATTLRARRGKP